MMKRLILQVNVPANNTVSKMFGKTFRYHKDLYDLSISQAKKYSQITNSDYMLITDNSFLPDMHPMYQRLKFFELTQYDQILYLDCDAVVQNDIPNIFTEYLEHSFNATQLCNFDSDSKYNQSVRQRYNKNYQASTNYKPFCSGVLLIRNDWLQQAKHIYKKYLDWSVDKNQDEGVLNRCVIELGEQYNILDSEYGSSYKTGKYITHLVGHKKNDFNLQKFKEKYKL